MSASGTSMPSMRDFTDTSTGASPVRNAATEAARSESGRRECSRATRTSGSASLSAPCSWVAWSTRSWKSSTRRSRRPMASVTRWAATRVRSRAR